MKVVILAGGQGSRLTEETRLIPKPMVEIGGLPILHHIMRIYAGYGLREFIIACGYKGEVIKGYFHSGGAHIPPDWNVSPLDTGLETLTGGRIKRLAAHLTSETFLVTYGDGVGDIDIDALIATHRRAGRLCTITAVRPPARFGSLAMDGDLVTEFSEKVQTREGWINGGFMVFEPGMRNLIAGDNTALENDLLEKLAAEGQMTAYRHEGFWHPMDTMRDKHLLEGFWNNGDAPWVRRARA